MYSSLTIAAVAAPLLRLAAAHGHVSGVSVNGGSVIAGANPNWYYLPADQRANTPGWRALNQDNGFVEPNNFGTSDVACHKSATPGQTYIEAKAGDMLKIFWDTWPDTHKGPVLNYMAPCNGDCTSASAGSLAFVKLSQGALISGNNPGNWVTDTLIRDNFSSDFKIPTTLAAGNYVLRHEIIALHAAGSPNGAQAYPQCLNVKITSGGSNTLSGGTRGSALYKATDPGIVFSLYDSFSSYPIPGPPLNAAGGSDGGSGGQQPPAPTTTLRTSTTTAAQPGPTTTPGNGNGGGGGCTVPKWQQCGGQSYSGCTTCVSGSTCQRQNDFYSQCT